MSNLFQFKQFSIQQELSAMKVGTDGVLLGAWMTPKEGNLLDIGAGTGLLSLMMAQRTIASMIDAVEIEKQAYQQALINSKASRWEDRIVVHHSRIQDFETNKKYDLIFSNPPYFIDSYKANESTRNTARHTDKLPHHELINSVKRLLKKEGIFAVILPVQEALSLMEEAFIEGLFLARKCLVKSNVNKASKRTLMEFSQENRAVVEEELIIEAEKRHQYTKEYINLTQDFYLNF